MKIIQLNIWGGELLTAACAFLQKEQPDIVLLEEVLVAPSRDVFRAVGKTLGMKGVYAKNYGMRFQGKPATAGNAVFSRFAILSHRAKFFDTTYCRYADRTTPITYHSIEALLQEPKNYLAVTLKTPHGPLRVVATHLAWSQRCSERMRRIEQARTLVRDLKGNLPTIIAGDFNTHPGSVSHQILADHFTDLGAGIKNTLNPRRHPVFKEGREGLAVDYILGASVHGSARTAPVDVSDHLPLIADIEIKRQKKRR